MVDFVIHWNETAMGLHVFPIPIPPSHLPLHPLPLGFPSAPGLILFLKEVWRTGMALLHHLLSASVWVTWPHTCSQHLSTLHSEMQYILQYTRLSSCSGAKSCPTLCGIPMTDCLKTLMEYVYSDFDEMEARPLKARVELSLLFCT